MLEQIHDAQFPIVTLPFFGTPVQVQLRELTQAQIYAAGGIDLSLIETFQDKIRLKKKPTIDEIVQYSEIMHAIARKALYKPTYDQIFETISEGLDTAKLKADLHALHEQLATLPNGPEAEALDKEITRMNIRINLLLPDDFLSGVTTYSLGVDKSDIKDVSEEMLYNAALTAKHGGDNPADHLKGRFTDFMREDINRRAWSIYYMKKKEIADGD